MTKEHNLLRNLLTCMLLAAGSLLAAVPLAERPLNPITDGLPAQGMRDYHITRDGDRWLLVGTEAPALDGKTSGLHLYISDDLQSWTKSSLLHPVNTTPGEAWYGNDWQAPELHKINGRWWLIFSSRNLSVDPFARSQIGLAVADRPEGPYTVVTSDPLAEGNNPTLLHRSNGELYAYWDRDGRIYGAPLDPEKFRFSEEPVALWPRTSNSGLVRLHTAPSLFEKDDRIYLFCSTFNHGYEIRYLVSEDPRGPFEFLDKRPVFTWRENQDLVPVSDEVLTHVPQVVVTGHVQAINGRDGASWFAYHSPGKRSPSRLCLDPFAIDEHGRVRFEGRTIGGEFVTDSPFDGYSAAVPEGIPHSDRYRVEIEKDGTYTERPVYWMEAAETTNHNRDLAWANVTVDEPVRVRVTRLDGGPVEGCSILPVSRDIQPSVSGADSIEFVIEDPGQYSVEFETSPSIAHPLLVFADPPEEPVDLEDEFVIHIPPGLHEWETPFMLRSHHTLYLEAGAWVRGQVMSVDGGSITIRGRGVLDGIRYPAGTGNAMIYLRNGADVEIEGITIVNAPRYAIAASGDNHHIRNVKVLGTWLGSVGMVAGQNSLIENCFIRTNGDAFRIFRSNTMIRDSVIWQMEQGAPFMLSWNTPQAVSGINVHNIDVIRVEHGWDGPGQAVIAAVHGGRANIRNALFEDITIDNASWRPFQLLTRPNPLALWHPESGSLSEITIRNFRFNGQPAMPSVIGGHDADHPVRDVRFENLVINGETVDDAEAGLFRIDQSTTRRINFFPEEPRPSTSAGAQD